jgi:hypothetical protein
LIEWLAPGAVESYAPAAHRAALAIMLIPQVLALVWYALARAR